MVHKPLQGLLNLMKYSNELKEKEHEKELIYAYMIGVVSTIIAIAIGYGIVELLKYFS